MANRLKLSERIGATSKNKHGYLMTVVDYKGNKDIEVVFDNGYRVRTNWQAFKKGEVKNVYERTVYEKGYLGEGPYKSMINRKITTQYNSWIAMLSRAYSDNLHKKYATYGYCFVAEEWHNFQTFAKWFDDNYYEIDGEVMQLDKDILMKGNKCYSPESCVFVPQRINLLFVKSDKVRGQVPLGVTYKSSLNVYHASVARNGKPVHLGTYYTKEEAFQAYKIAKEAYIKEVAEEYKDRIPNKLYAAMVAYEVSVED